MGPSPSSAPKAPRRTTAGARSKPACRHCGAPLSDERNRPSGFCCAGCAYVYRLVHENGLESYYRIKDEITAPADPTVFQPHDFSWLETAQKEAEAASGARPPELTLGLQGVSCAGCIWLIERLFSARPGAREIEANAQLGQMRIRWIPGEFSAAGFAAQLQSFGYLVGPGGEAPAFMESRALIRRIGLCAAFTLNVMLFVFPSYFGMKPTFEYAPLFGLLALAGGTLSFLVGGTYFVGRAFRALRAKALHIDLPIAIGIVGAYLGSVYGWLADEPHLTYFDFVSTFILLMLVGRWAQVVAVERNQRRLLAQQPKPQRIRLAAGGEMAPEELRPGLDFLTASGQTVPVESCLESPEAAFSLASINGEAEPRDYRRGQTVPAGAVNVSRSDVRLRSLEAWEDSLIAQLLRPVTRAGIRHPFLEKVIGGYLIGIIGVAVLSGVAWWFAGHDVARTWSVVTAVLVVSCPCAIGLAFPLADEIATVALRRRGVFVRDGDLWMKICRIRHLVFDKTGTLTLETPVLQNPEAVESLDPPARTALLALVHDNPHPISVGLLENLLAGPPHSNPPGAGGPSNASPPPGTFREVVGQGVTYSAGGHVWSLGRPGWQLCSAASEVRREAAAPTAEFARDGHVLARFHFADTVRPDAPSEIAALADLGFSIRILSGDRAHKVAALARALGLAPGQAIGELSPHEKAAWLTANGAEKTLMLGDGANDSLAFDQALCRGTPVIHRGVLEQKADFYYLGRGIGGLRALFAVNAARRRTQHIILVFSIVYNVLAVSLAVAGWMNPLIAAVLMPANSLLTLALVTAGMRRAMTV